ncbi:hypothetical protein ACA910_015479 [Epithemia clementina (nom. ined.)]
MPCCVYRDSYLITAQVVSIVAFLLSFAGLVAFLLGLAAMIVLQVVWCCRLNQCGLTTAATFAAVVACLNLGWAIAIFVQGSDVCSDIVWVDDDDDTLSSSSSSKDCPWTAFGICLLISAALWLVVSALVVWFVHGPGRRLEHCRYQSDPERRAQAAEAAAAVAGGEIALVAATPLPDLITSSAATASRKTEPTPRHTYNNNNNNNHPMQTTTTTTMEFPDGSIQTVTTMTHPDGSQTVTETMERPSSPTLLVPQPPPP